MQFFDELGNKISKEKFISIYSKSYFINEKRLVKGVSQNSSYAESEIEKILKNGIKTELDIVHILAWKIGKINHKKSTDKFVYADDWTNADKFNVKRYGKKFELSLLAEYIVNNINNLENEVKTNPQNVLNRLKSLNINGLGTVYLITLLYFISKGEYPIYDRFAKIAIDAISGDKTPGSFVEYNELPEKNSREFETVIEQVIEYKKQIEDIFGTEHIKNRDIDRALWVYGHSFTNKKTHC